MAAGIMRFPLMRCLLILLHVLDGHSHSVSSLKLVYNNMLYMAHDGVVVSMLLVYVYYLQKC